GIGDGVLGGIWPLENPDELPRSYVFGCTLRHDRDDVKLVLLVHNASDLCRKTKRSAFDEPTGETHGPCVDAFFRGYVGLPRQRRRRRLALREGLSIGGQLEAEHG